MAMELMSPAGSMEGVIAAVRSGANAVYFGTGDFNARRNAKNLEGDELAEAFRYCRLRGVKTYVTMNTLVTDRELLRAKELVAELSALGADALIVQDLGMAKLIREVAPDLPIHASTQLTLHNLGGVLEAQELGFTRVVLSRELPLREIRFICQRSPLEIEIFVHGALCMCYSGQCFLSSAIGGRSGNRGLCAQPCRMAYSFGGETGHPLSLKDLSLAHHLGELEEAGVHTLKIEGRMKRPEYTALVTGIYRRALDEHRAPTPEELEQLQTAFSRDGFTDGYYAGRRGADMFGTRQEENGRAARALYKQAQAVYRAEPEPPCVPVTLEFSAQEERPMELIARDGDGNWFRAEGQPAEKAIRRATTEDEVRSSLAKTGGTVFEAKEMQISLGEGLRASAAALNAMRRQCLEGMERIRSRAPERRTGDWQPGVRRLPYEGRPGWIVSLRSAEQLSSPMLHAHPDLIYLPLSEMAANLPMLQALRDKGIAFASVLDRILFDSQWPRALEQLRQVKAAGFDEVVCTNMGQLPFLRKLGLKIRGDFGLNVMNSQTVKELKKLGLSAATLSFEMNLAQIRDLNLCMDCELIAYGRLPLMITENCITPKHGDHCPHDGSGCAGGVSLQDKTGRQFPVLRENYCRSTLYNAEPLWLADKRSDLMELGVRWLRLNFTTEKPKEIERVIRAYLQGEGTEMPDRATRGLYYRGVQ